MSRMVEIGERVMGVIRAGMAGSTKGTHVSNSQIGAGRVVGD